MVDLQNRATLGSRLAVCARGMGHTARNHGSQTRTSPEKTPDHCRNTLQFPPNIPQGLARRQIAKITKMAKLGLFQKHARPLVSGLPDSPDMEVRNMSDCTWAESLRRTSASGLLATFPNRAAERAIVENTVAMP